MFLDNATKVCYFTGLPSLKMLNVSFEFVAPHVPNSQSTLPAFKVRLNADNQLLSSLFNVHTYTVTGYFQKWIDVMYERLKPLVKWPDHE